LGVAHILEDPKMERNQIGFLGIYLGITESGGETGPSFGVDYERRLTRRFGIGAEVEYTGAGGCYLNGGREWRGIVSPRR
jgi:hypothetical protein